MAELQASVEIVRPEFPRGPFRLAVWDFDGTLSLYRGGWQPLMVEMMVEALAGLRSTESRTELAALAEEWVVTLNGKPTIHQMTKLAEEVARRGGATLSPLAYCDQYQTKLLALVNERMQHVEQRRRQPLDYGVAGVESMLAMLKQRNAVLALCSGTEHEYVDRELHALGLQHYFGEHVYAPQGHEKQFSKADIFADLMQRFSVSGPQLVSFGDGIVETTEAKRLGGCAVGVASNEHDGVRVDADKRRRLIKAGADLIVPHFLGYQQLADVLHLS